MKGQLTYDKDTKSWKYTEPNKLTPGICQSSLKVESRNGYYLARVHGEHKDFDSLSDGILWVEKTVSIK